MAKRIADKELTDRNWDQEDEGEEAGTFSIASDDVMKSRPIKKAKRRNPGTEGESAGAFKVFKGFSLAPTPAAGGGITAFSGFGNGTGFKGLSGLTNGNSATPAFGGFTTPATATTTPGSLTFNGPASTTPASADITGKQTNGSAPSLAQSTSSISGSSSSSNKEYSRQLTALNCSVRDWITKHVNGNPLCDLNPIFRDYEQHLANIEKKYGGGAAAAGGASAAAAAAAADGGSESKATQGEEKQGGLQPSSNAAQFSSGSSSVATAIVPTPTPSLFSFGQDGAAAAAPPEKSSAAPVPAGISFNFGQKVDSAALGSLGSGGAPPSFSFSSTASSLFGTPASAAAPAATFSFSGAKAEAATKTTAENGEEESEEPPKPEVKEIKEQDAFYSKKCKLFYKKESEFKEKGVGTLHLKETAEGKTQLLVRADTNLGNILLNIMVQASMPCSRMGKNNVMVVCVPNPAVDDKNPTSPVPMLIRVKTTEDADQLLKILQEKKV